MMMSSGDVLTPFAENKAWVSLSPECNAVLFELFATPQREWASGSGKYRGFSPVRVELEATQHEIHCEGVGRVGGGDSSGH